MFSAINMSAPQAEHLLNFLYTRRSIRKFKQIEVTDDVIKRILDVARYAPSARNSQPWIFIVVKDKELKSRLAKIHRGAQPLESAPLGILVACSETASPDSHLVDCANVTIYIMLAAHALGLGTVWIQTLRNVDDIRKLVNLPEDYVPVALLAVGYPDEKPEPRPRKPLNEITFLDRYGKPYIH